jgi:hypothetical protein
MSRDIVQTTVVSGGLENIRLAFGNFQLSFTLIESFLLQVYGSCYLFPVLPDVARRRSNFHYVGQPRKRRLAFGISFLSFTVVDLMLLPVSGGQI